MAAAAAGFGMTRFLGLLLPRRWLLGLGRTAAPLLYHAVPGLRRSLLDNAAPILGPGASLAERRALAVGVLASFSRFTIEVVMSHRRLPVGADLFETMRGREHYERARAAGRGIIGVTLHLGNYEVGPMLLARRVQPLAVVYTRDPVPLFERLRDRRRRAQGVSGIPIDGSPLFTLDVRSVLRRGGMVLVAADLGFDAPGAGDVYEFLGAPAPFWSWPARLALASGAPLLPCFIVRDEAGSYRLDVAAPLFPVGAGGDDEGEAVREMMRPLVALFEEYVRRYPEQWLIIHRYWRSGGGEEAA
jgi:KDO2-lipid IV(A) lauroyltransferase